MQHLNELRSDQVISLGTVHTVHPAAAQCGVSAVSLWFMGVKDIFRITFIDILGEKMTISPGKNKNNMRSSLFWEATRLWVVFGSRVSGQALNISCCTTTYTETSVTNHQPTPRNIAEEWGPQLQSGPSLNLIQK